MMRNYINSDEGGGGRRMTTTTTTVQKKGPWSVTEDMILIDYVRKHGEGNWNSVQKNCDLPRCGKSCRLRWANHLRPNLKKGSITHEEEVLILQLHAQYGNKWARMATQMPGRTDNEIKNYWNTRIKRRQRAGLPLYPTRLSSAHPPSMVVPSSPSSPLQHSPLQLFKQPPLSNPWMSESPRVKRTRDDGLTFQFPLGSPYMHQHHPLTNNMFQYNNNKTYGNSRNFNEMNMNVLRSTMVLPSAKLYNGGDGGCGLMDALLQDQGGSLVFSYHPPTINDNGSNGDDKDLFVDSPTRFEELRCPDGIRIKRMAMSPPPEWQTLTITDSCGISNEGRLSVVTDDEIGLELQHLASSFPTADQEWNIGSCPWNNMPGIGLFLD